MAFAADEAAAADYGADPAVIVLLLLLEHSVLSRQRKRASCLQQLLTVPATSATVAYVSSLRATVTTAEGSGIQDLWLLSADRVGSGTTSSGLRSAILARRAKERRMKETMENGKRLG